VFVTKGDENVPAAELSGRLLAHVCRDDTDGQ